MTKKEFRQKLKLIGLSYDKFCAVHGVSKRTIYAWDKVPSWAEYWLEWRIAQSRLDWLKEEFLREMSDSDD